MPLTDRRTFTHILSYFVSTTSVQNLLSRPSRLRQSRLPYVYKNGVPSSKGRGSIAPSCLLTPIVVPQPCVRHIANRFRPPVLHHFHPRPWPANFRKAGQDLLLSLIGQYIYRRCCTYLSSNRQHFLLEWAVEAPLAPEFTRSGPPSFFLWPTAKSHHGSADL